MMLLCLLAALAAFALFGLSYDAHHQQRIGDKITPLRKRRMRIAAWLCVAATLPLGMAAAGPVFGPILAFGTLMLAAGIIFLSLNLLPAKGGRGK